MESHDPEAAAALKEDIALAKTLDDQEFLDDVQRESDLEQTDSDDDPAYGQPLVSKPSKVLPVALPAGHVWTMPDNYQIHDDGRNHILE